MPLQQLTASLCDDTSVNEYVLFVDPDAVTTGVCVTAEFDGEIVLEGRAVIKKNDPTAITRIIKTTPKIITFFIKI
jgi:hypothetical protein